jgi:hypothetical protein
VAVIIIAFGTEDRGFEPRQGGMRYEDIRCDEVFNVYD